MTLNLAARVITRATRFPSPLAKSELYLSSSLLMVKSPSSVEGFSLKRKYLTGSAPYLLTNSKGSITFPKVFDIFWPAEVTKPWMKICLDVGKPAERSIACHIEDC